MRRIELVVILTMALALACAPSAHGRRVGSTLPPDLLCSACEVVTDYVTSALWSTKASTAIEVGSSLNEPKHYTKLHYASSEVRVIEVLDEVCDRVGRESFGIANNYSTRTFVNVSDSSAASPENREFERNVTRARLPEHAKAIKNVCIEMVSEHDEILVGAFHTNQQAMREGKLDKHEVICGPALVDVCDYSPEAKARAAAVLEADRIAHREWRLREAAKKLNESTAAYASANATFEAKVAMQAAAAEAHAAALAAAAEREAELAAARAVALAAVNGDESALEPVDVSNPIDGSATDLSVLGVIASLWSGVRAGSAAEAAVETALAALPADEQQRARALRTELAALAERIADLKSEHDDAASAADAHEHKLTGLRSAAEEAAATAARLARVAEREEARAKKARREAVAASKEAAKAKADEEEALASAAAAETELSAAKSELASATVALDGAQAQAAAHNATLAVLLTQSEPAPVRAFKDAKAALESARANEQSAAARKTQAETDLDAAKRRVESTRGAVKLASSQLSELRSAQRDSEHGSERDSEHGSERDSEHGGEREL